MYYPHSGITQHNRALRFHMYLEAAIHFAPRFWQNHIRPLRPYLWHRQDEPRLTHGRHPRKRKEPTRE